MPSQILNTMRGPDAEDDDEQSDVTYVLVELTRDAKNLPGPDGKPSGATRQFWERHPSHPPQFEGDESGEVRVAGNDVVLVAQTDRVREAISRGILREVTGKKEPTPSRVQIVDMLNAGQLNFDPPQARPLIDAGELIEAVKIAASKG